MTIRKDVHLQVAVPNNLEGEDQGHAYLIGFSQQPQYTPGANLVNFSSFSLKVIARTNGYRRANGRRDNNTTGQQVATAM